MMYLMSRGLGRDAAEKVFKDGFVEEMFGMLEKHGLGEEINMYRQQVVQTL